MTSGQFMEKLLLVCFGWGKDAHPWEWPLGSIITLMLRWKLCKIVITFAATNEFTPRWMPSLCCQHYPICTQFLVILVITRLIIVVHWNHSFQFSSNISVKFTSEIGLWPAIFTIQQNKQNSS